MTVSASMQGASGNVRNVWCATLPLYTPSRRFCFFRRAKPSLAAANIHSDSRVNVLVMHVVNPFVVAVDVSLNRAFG